jgi:hypothetical protein
MKNAVRRNLFRRPVCLKSAYDVRHLDTAFVGYAVKEGLVRQKGDDRNEIGRCRCTVINVAASGSQNADVITIWIIVRVVHDPIDLTIPSRGARPSEYPETLRRRQVQLTYVDSVCRVKRVIEIEGRWIEARKVGPAY